MTLVVYIGLRYNVTNEMKENISGHTLDTTLWLKKYFWSSDNRFTERTDWREHVTNSSLFMKTIQYSRH